MLESGKRAVRVMVQMGMERLSLWNSIAELLYKARSDCKCSHVVVHVILPTSPQEEGAIHTGS